METEIQSPIGYFVQSGSALMLEPMQIAVQHRGVSRPAKFAASVFGEAVDTFALNDLYYAAVVVRIHRPEFTPRDQRDEASITLPLSVAEQLRDALAQAIEAAQRLDPSVVTESKSRA